MAAKSDSAGPSDEALVSAALGGEVRAFETLLDRHQERVLRVLRLLGVAPQDRDDVAQEVFIRVFRHLGSFRSGHPFAGWLYRVTVNAAHDHRRRARRRASDEAEWAGPVEEAPDDRPGPAELLAEEELRRLLDRALAGLTERERAVFVLREVEGLETRRVARILGVTAITVRRHLGRARIRVRRLLEAGPGFSSSR